MSKLWLGRWLLIVASLLCIARGAWQNEAEEQLPSANTNIKFITKYFKTDTDGEVVLILSKLNYFLERHIKNPCVYDVAIVNSSYTNELTLYWNRTAILLKHSSLMNYTKEYTIELLVNYRPSCDGSIGCEESEKIRPVNVPVKLRPLDIHLESPGELLEGQPLQLNCTIFGHTPKDINKVKIKYWSGSSGAPIANCSNVNHEANHGFDYDILNNTCELSAHSTQSNSGDYYCTASIGDMEVSSEDVVLNVGPRIDWKTIVGAAVGSAAGLIVLIILLAIIVVKITRCRPNPEPGVPPAAGPQYGGEEGENVHLLHNGLREDIIPNFNRYQALRVDEHRRIEANQDRREGGRRSPTDSDRSKPGDHDSLVLSDQGGYESNV